MREEARFSDAGHELMIYNPSVGLNIDIPSRGGLRLSLRLRFILKGILEDGVRIFLLLFEVVSHQQYKKETLDIL